MTIENQLASRKGRSYRGPYAYLVSDEQYLERVRSRCEQRGACLEWRGWKNHKGYGEISYRNRSWFVHRLVYALTIGPIPPGKLVCHTCDNRACCTSEHLFLGTEADNNRDCGNKGRHHNGKKTHCKRGHEFTFENTYLKVTAKTVMRACKACQREKQRREWRENPEKMRLRQQRARLRRKQQLARNPL